METFFQFGSRLGVLVEAWPSVWFWCLGRMERSSYIFIFDPEVLTGGPTRPGGTWLAYPTVTPNLRVLEHECMTDQSTAWATRLASSEHATRAACTVVAFVVEKVHLSGQNSPILVRQQPPGGTEKSRKWRPWRRITFVKRIVCFVWMALDHEKMAGYQIRSNWPLTQGHEYPCPHRMMNPASAIRLQATVTCRQLRLQ